MKLPTKMFLTLLLTVAVMALLQHILLQVQRNLVGGYAASFGGRVEGVGSLSTFFKNRVKAPPKKYTYKDFHCSANVCSFNAKGDNVFAKHFTIVVDKDRLMQECMSPDSKVSSDICKYFDGSLREAGWEVIRGDK